MKMSEPTLYEFLEQQIELYGDELAIPLSTLEQVGFKRPGVTTPSWKTSMNLEELHESIRNCQNCPRCISRQQVILGQGRPQAMITIVSDMPDDLADQHRVPVAGEEHDLLEKILAAVQIGQNETYFCNVLKCRGSRPAYAFAEEIKQCVPYLKKQLQLIRSPIILCLGELAAQTILSSKKKLFQLRGTVYKYQDAQVVVTHHLRDLLTSVPLKKETWADIKTLRRLYDEKLR